jgi:hypothetical protein
MMMKRILCLFLMMLAYSLSFAVPGPLFTVADNGTQLTVSPTSNHYYPSMGIKLTSQGNSVGGCTPHANGFCLFAASNTSPKVLTLAGPRANNLAGIICLNGPAHYSCQNFSIKCSLPGGTCRVFTSSSRYRGDMFPHPVSGILGGNQICQNLANTARLGGTWKAWLSSSSINARDNIQYNSTLTYVRARSGLTVAKPGRLIPNSPPPQFILENSLNEDENGNTVLNPFAPLVWTGTDVFGQKIPGRNCSDWTSIGADTAIFGSHIATEPLWTNTAFATCNIVILPIFCFEVPS